jgi:hypothetical protein
MSDVVEDSEHAAEKRTRACVVKGTLDVWLISEALTYRALTKPLLAELVEVVSTQEATRGT